MTASIDVSPGVGTTRTSANQDESKESVQISLGCSGQNKQSFHEAIEVRAQQAPLLLNTKIAILILLNIWVINFLLAFAAGVIDTLTPYVTSSFGQHSLTATTSVLSNVIGGLVKLPYAKLVVVWGRTKAFALSFVSLVIGLIMLAASKNVSTYIAARVFYTIGHTSMSFSLTIFIADNIPLRKRGWWIAILNSPTLITVWAYGPAAQAILGTIGFSWGFGIWAIALPVACVPLLLLFSQIHNEHEKLNSERSENGFYMLRATVMHWTRQFDLMGIVLLAGGISLILLAFNVNQDQPGHWSSPFFICCLAIGESLLVAFILYERYLAPVCFIPWNLMRNQTIISAYVLALSMNIAWYVWNSYFYSMLIVVWDTDVMVATYILNIWSVGAVIWGLLVGIAIQINGKVKWHVVFIGIPMMILGTGLMILFGRHNMSIGYIVLCQVLLSFGLGTIVICEQMALMFISTKQDTPAVLATESMFFSLGQSIGSTISSAIWQTNFEERLSEYLPKDSKANLPQIYGSLGVQSSYPPGTAVRKSICRSYSETVELMLVVSICLLAVSWGSSFLWKNINVKDTEEVEESSATRSLNSGTQAANAQRNDV